MGKESVEHINLKERITDLEQELVDRENDITLLRNELTSTSQKLAGFIVKLEQDLKILHAIQYAIMPSELPRIPGFEFSQKFVASSIQGGDYYEVMEHSDKARFGIFLSAASRYTMSSILLSAVMAKSPLIQNQRGLTPANFLQSLFSEMKQLIEATDTADLFYGVVDRRSFTLNFCLMGDVLGLHQTGTPKELKLLKPTGPIMSADLGGSEIIENQVKLQAEDRIILASRGLVEAKNSSGEEFGRERFFSSVLSAPLQGVHELRNKIFYDLEMFCKNAQTVRDQTLLVVAVKDRVITLATV